MNKDKLAKVIAVIGSIAVIAHLLLFAVVRYNYLYFLLGLCIFYLTLPLMRRIKKSG